MNEYLKDSVVSDFLSEQGVKALAEYYNLSVLEVEKIIREELVKRTQERSY